MHANAMMDVLDDYDVVDKSLAQCGLYRHQVAEIAPCTPLQQTLAKDVVACGAWSYQAVFEVLGDTARAMNAFQLVIAQTSILRTRLAKPGSVDSKTYQVIERPAEVAVTKVAINLDDHLKREQSKRIAYGQPLTHLALVQDPVQTYLVLSWVRSSLM